MDNHSPETCPRCCAKAQQEKKQDFRNRVLFFFVLFPIYVGLLVWAWPTLREAFFFYFFSN